MTSMFFTDPLFYGREQISIPGHFCDLKNLRDINNKPVRDISSMILSIEFSTEPTLDVTIFAPSRKGTRPNRVVMSIKETMQLVIHALEGVFQQLNMEIDVINQRVDKQNSLQILRRYLDSAERFRVMATQELNAQNSYLQGRI